MPSYQPTIIRIKSIYALIKLSLSGANQDYTQGSIRKAVILLAIPMMLEMCMESVFAVVDIFFVGRISSDAVAIVGLTESVLTIVYSVAIGLSMAATAIVARRVGEKNPQEAARSAVQAIILSMALTVVMSIAGVIFSPAILRVMGGSANIISIGSSYTRIVFGSSAVIMLLYLINGIFRGAGNAFIAMWSLWIANGFNIVLCPIMIHFYGLRGAAVATMLGRGAGVCYQLYHLFKGSGKLRILRKYFKPDLEIIRTIVKISWTGTFQFLIGSASWIVMVRIISKFGSEAIAGYQVFIRVLLFFLLPAWGMSNAAATLVGQNLGAGQPQRAEKSVWTAVKYNTVFMVLVSLLFLLASEQIVGFINKDPGVQKMAVAALHIVSLGYIIYGAGMVFTNAFNGAGDTTTPTIINLFCFWAFQVPMAYFLSISFSLGPKGVFIAIISAETAISLVSYLIFKRGRWKKTKV